MYRIFGGLDRTYDGIFTNMKPNCGMAFVVIQHLKADSSSLTPAILSRITRIKVTAAIDQERALPNHVYTIDTNTQLTIVDGRFSIQTRTESGNRTGCSN